MGRIQSNRISRETRISRSPRSALRRAGYFSAGTAFGLALAASVTQFFPTSEPEQTNSRGHSALLRIHATEQAQRIEIPNTQPDSNNTFLEWLAMAESERLDAMASKIRGAGLDLVAESVIGRLEDDSLKSLIASTTDFSSDELEEIEDLPGFAMNLARIAMEGTLRDAAEPGDSETIRPIDFSEEITWDHRARFAQSQFPSDAPRIYAVFESDALGITDTLAKWTRVEDGEIMLFKRHRIRPAADSSFVYLDAPATGWAPGEYRVDFYSADPELEWLATGSHRVSL